jgi:hypothetical protein
VHTDRAKELLRILIENSVRILEAGFGLAQVESNFFDVVELVRHNPILRSEFLAHAAATFSAKDPGLLQSGAAPRELIELMAHEMRWPELRELAEDRIERVFGGDRSLMVGDISESLLAAFQPDWGDREFYKSYHSR